MSFPEDLRYTEDHEWIRIDGGTGIAGITDYAQGELGDIVFVVLPEIGKKVKRGESFGSVEAVKAVADLYAPVSGEVIAVNLELEKSPELVNKDPYNGGWMIKIKITDSGEINKLHGVKKYRELIGK